MTRRVRIRPRPPRPVTLLPAAAALVSLVLAAAAAAPLTEVIVAEARLDRFVDRVEALGTLRANEAVALTASVTETVTAIHFDDGDRVEAGQVLIEMTSAEERAVLEETRDPAAAARRQYDRVKALVAQGTAAESLLDERRRQWEAARARLGAIESRLQDRIVKAPFAGVVGLRDLSLGALVEPGDVITTLDDDSVMKLEFSVPSVHLEALSPGLPVVARARPFDERTFRGTVKAVDSRVDPVTRSVLVRAILPNPDRLLKPGMLMHVDLISNPRQAVALPEEAVMFQGEEQYVYVVDRADGNRVQRRRVRLGVRRAGEVEVVEGLEAGETVITHGTGKVRPGQSVSIAAQDDGTGSLRELLVGDDGRERP